MDDIKVEVRRHYATIAVQPGGCGTSDCCSDGTPPPVAFADMMGVEAEANLGLGCGMPTRFADIRPGETVLDLGSGAGIDVFLAARAVGPTGRVIGVDMTPEMIARAWDNAIRGGYGNVDFRLGDIEALPVDDGSIDVVLSNCVINLAPDKHRVFAEIHRVLRPGGRFSISDIVTHGHVPESIRADMELWAGCVAGALDRDDYLRLIGQAGFVDVQVNASVEYDAVKGDGYGLSSITVAGRKV